MGAVASFVEDVGDAIGDVVESVGDVVEDVVDVVGDVVEKVGDVVEAVIENPVPVPTSSTVCSGAMESAASICAR